MKKRPSSVGIYIRNKYMREGESLIVPSHNQSRSYQTDRPFCETLEGKHSLLPETVLRKRGKPLRLPLMNPASRSPSLTWPLFDLLNVPPHRRLRAIPSPSTFPRLKFPLSCEQPQIVRIAPHRFRQVRQRLILRLRMRPARIQIKVEPS